MSRSASRKLPRFQCPFCRRMVKTWDHCIECHGKQKAERAQRADQQGHNLRGDVVSMNQQERMAELHRLKAEYDEDVRRWRAGELSHAEVYLRAKGRVRRLDVIDKARRRERASFEVWRLCGFVGVAFQLLTMFYPLPTWFYLASVVLVVVVVWRLMTWR